MPAVQTSANPLAKIAEHCPLGDEARVLLAASQSADACVIALRNAGLYLDALYFVAYWLEKRQAIWWGCQCLWRLLRPEVSARHDAALRAMVAWVFDPSEEARRHCEHISEEVGASQPLGVLALGVFASSGSLAPRDLPAVPVPEMLTARCVAVALSMAGTDTPDRYREFVFLGVDIAHGQNLWN